MIKPEDIQLAQTLGYTLDTADMANLANDLNQHFPGLELNKLLNKFEELLAAYSTQPENKKIKYENTPEPLLRIQYLSANYDDDIEGLTLSRIFRYNKQKLIAEHEYFVLPEKARGKKIGKKVLSACLEQYLNMNVKEIHVHAGLKDGGVVWAKVGFKALYRFEMNRILNSAQQLLTTEQYVTAKVLYDLYYNTEPNGISFPIEDWAYLDFMENILKLDTNNWHGWIDLTNLQELLNFKNYVDRQ